MDAQAAAKKAFSKCSKASDRSVATFLARQYLIDARASLACLPEVEELLDTMFVGAGLMEPKTEVTSATIDTEPGIVQGYPHAYRNVETAWDSFYEAQNQGQV